MAENNKVTWPQIVTAMTMMAMLSGGFLGWGEIRQQLKEQNKDIDGLVVGISGINQTLAIVTTQTSLNSQQLASRRDEITSNRNGVRQLEIESATERQKLEAAVNRIDDALNKGIFGQVEIIRRLDRILNQDQQDLDRNNERGR